MNLIRADTIPVGSEIWTEDETDGGEEVWVLAQVVQQANTLITARKKNTGEEMEIDLVSNCFLPTMYSVLQFLRSPNALVMSGKSPSSCGVRGG